MRQTGSQSKGGREPLVIQGIGASQGIAVGPVVVIQRRTFRAGQYFLPPEQVEHEVERFKTALEQAEQELAALRREFATDLSDALSIIDSHILMLRDQMIQAQTTAIIRSEKVNAEWALARSLTAIKIRFDRIADPYIKERYADIKHLADRLFGLLAGREREPLVGKHERVILVANDFSPEDILRMHAENILGFLSEKGGMTSHTAILARSLAIPAVVGLEHITGSLATGDMIILDGHAGRVFVHPSLDQLRQYDEYERQHRTFSDELAYYIHLASETFDGHRVRLSANIEVLDELDTVLRYGAEGIGLFRSEFDYFRSKCAPSEEQLYTNYRKLLQTVAPHPLTVRTLDVGGDKFAGQLPTGDLHLDMELNPALGMRSIRFSLFRPDIFVVQLRALLRASIHGRLRIMLPLVSSLAELRRVKELCRKITLDLDHQAIAYDARVELGIIVEVPSAVIMADAIAKEVDFFSIGTNDLIQYSLAVDRCNQYVAHMYEPLHPAVLRMVRQTVDCGHAQGISVAVCGEMAGDIRCAPVLFGLGVDELSMRPSALPHIKRILRRSTTNQLRNLAEQVLRCEDTQEVHALLATTLPAYYPEEFPER